MDNEKKVEAVKEPSTNKRPAPEVSGDQPPAKRAARSNMPMDMEEYDHMEPPTRAKKSSKLKSPDRKLGSPVLEATTNSAPSTPQLTEKRGPGRPRKNANTDAAKAFKGLRHFSMMVCKKVEEKGETTYNEVADELVKQVLEVRKREEPNGKFDEKNIRRRVYDSINVLLAMDIIAKDKKQISWKGLPSTAQHDLQLLEREEEARKEQVQAKRKALKEILLQQICFRNLVTRNKAREVEQLHAEKVPLPFIVVNTHKDAVIHCNMAHDLTNVLFEYDRPFEINDDNSILTRLGMHKTTIPDLNEMVPEDLVQYCQEHGILDSVLKDSSKSKPAKALDLTSERGNRGQYFRDRKSVV